MSKSLPMPGTPGYDVLKVIVDAGKPVRCKEVVAELFGKYTRGVVEGRIKSLRDSGAIQNDHDHFYTAFPSAVRHIATCEEPQEEMPIVEPPYVAPFRPLDVAKHFRITTPRGDKIERRSFYSTNTAINPAIGRL